MKKYKVEIIETLSRVVEVHAHSKDEAVDIVKQLYEEREIVLDYTDYLETEIDLM